MRVGYHPTMAGFERGQVVQLILTKVVFACEKPLVVTLRWARRLPPSCRPGSLGLVTPEWKPLADSLGLRACGLPSLHRRGNLRSAPAWPWSSWLTLAEPHEVHLA